MNAEIKYIPFEFDVETFLSISIGRSRKSGGQKVDLISLLLNKFS